MIYYRFIEQVAAVCKPALLVYYSPEFGRLSDSSRRNQCTDAPTTWSRYVAEVGTYSIHHSQFYATLLDGGFWPVYFQHAEEYPPQLDRYWPKYSLCLGKKSNQPQKSQRHVDMWEGGDCSEQYVVRSVSMQTENATFSGKYMAHTISILAAVDPKTGHVLVLSDSFPGSRNDQQIFHTILWDDLVEPNQMILGDQGFTGDRILHPPRTTLQRAENSEINETRIIVENTFGWIKNWRICADKLRCKALNQKYLLDRHQRNWCIVSALLNRFGVLRATNQ